MLSDVTVIKVGGNEVDDRDWTASLAVTICTLDEPVVLVHGGGKEVSDLQRALGAVPEWRDGLRVTTPEALRAVSMVLSGLVNKRLVSALMAAGREAVGISGEDSGLFLAEAARGGEMGRTGTIVEVRRRIIDMLLGAGYVPVISPVSRGTDGGSLNVNADDAASALAVALGARRLLMISNVSGLLQDGSVVPEIESSDVAALIVSGVASGGMGPKLLAAESACLGGVGEVRIGGLDLLTSGAGGTRVVMGASIAATA
jgi:acetylglutamate kinase